MQDLDPRIESVFFKGPVTACEYYDNDHVLIGYGPYLGLFRSQTLDQVTVTNALKYRVIHKIVFGPLVNDDHKLICVVGQKALNVLRLNEGWKFESVLNDQYIEMNDWIFDVYWFSNHQYEYLVAVGAHNQSIFYDWERRVVEKCVYCSQKCMLYSATLFDLSAADPGQRELQNIYVASGTVFNQVLIWSSTSGQVHAKLEAHKGVIFNIAIDLDSRMLFSVSDDRFICVWRFEVEEIPERNTSRVSNGCLHARLYGHDARVWNCVPFRYESKRYLASIGEDLNCCLWDLEQQALVHRFSAMRKCTKNIWSLCMKRETLQLLTGWADGGLRRFDFKNYLHREQDASLESKDTSSSTLTCLELAVSKDQANRANDFVRCAVIVAGRVVYCTNLGFLYMIDDQKPEADDAHYLLLQSDELKDQYTMSKAKISKSKWCLVLAASKGSMYQLILDFDDHQSRDNFKCQINVIPFAGYQPPGPANMSPGEFKICNFIWSEYWDERANRKRFYLSACHSLVTGLVLLYELDSSNDQLVLIARLKLPECKQRWLASLAVIDVHSETLWLSGGDKCGNIHLYRVKTEMTINEPLESIKRVTKYQSAIPSIYSKNKIKTLIGEEEAEVTCLLIYCCHDGFYRVYEFSTQPTDHQQEAAAAGQNEPSRLKLINKYQINSYIDVIEAFITESDLTGDDPLQEQTFDLEQDLSIAVCFYGDRFLLWSFHLNRALLDVQCGGANRSWDLSIEINKSAHRSEIRFVYGKNKVVNQVRKLFDAQEIRRTREQLSNHFCQIFHGNTITTCKFFNQSYLLTAGEDTQIIVTHMGRDVSHQFHLQGHDSVVRCLATFSLSEREVLLVSGGGKANIKLWKIFTTDSTTTIEKITQVNDFKRIYAKKPVNTLTHLSAAEKKSSPKPWHYIDMDSNPDIRFMDCQMVSYRQDVFICFACSDGVMRVFKYDQATNYVSLVNKHVHPKCLLCMKSFRVASPFNLIDSQPYILWAGTDGRGLLWRFDPQQDSDIQPFVLDNLNQSGINCLEVYQDAEESSRVWIASVGDDTRLCLVELEIGSEKIEQRTCIRHEMAHASCISSVKFLSNSLLMTVAKDQRLVIWSVDHQAGKIEPLRTWFVNVADVSSMDVVWNESENCITVAVVGIGLEVLSIKL